MKDRGIGLLIGALIVYLLMKSCKEPEYIVETYTDTVAKIVRKDSLIPVIIEQPVHHTEIHYIDTTKPVDVKAVNRTLAHCQKIDSMFNLIATYFDTIQDTSVRVVSKITISQNKIDSITYTLENINRIERIKVKEAAPARIGVGGFLSVTPNRATLSALLTYRINKGEIIIGKGLGSETWQIGYKTPLSFK